jgi:hypothetical protein
MQERDGQLIERGRISNSEASFEWTPPGLSKNDQPPLYSLHKRIDRLRESIWVLRPQVQVQRSILQSKRNEQATADDKYMQLVRLKESEADKRHLRSGGRKSLELFQECERLRREDGPLEDDCSALEDRIGREEYELTILEEDLGGSSNWPFRMTVNLLALKVCLKNNLREVALM